MSNYTAEGRHDPLLDFSTTSPVIQETLQHLTGVLPSVVSELIVRHQDMSDPANQSFAQSPDDPAEHAPDWHQFGILTHSERFGAILRAQVPGSIAKWGLTEPLRAVLAEPIDDIPKAQLLSVAAVVHDIGKFTARTISRDETGVHTSFTDHEAHSGRIIASRKDLLPVLTRAQVGYVAACAALHFELGKVRRAAKAVGGYTIAFTESSAFSTAAREILAAHPSCGAEIGLEFIADNVSKADVAATGQTDEAVSLEQTRLATELQRRGLPASLINQALQMPTNLAVAQEYLKIWAEERSAA